MRKLIVFMLVVAASGGASAQVYGYGSNSESHYVAGHTRNDGSYVEPHYRTNSNNSRNDNYGALGNYNPHNGRYGSGY